jgi:hypothetical protein
MLDCAEYFAMPLPTGSEIPQSSSAGAEIMRVPAHAVLAAQAAKSGAIP